MKTTPLPTLESVGLAAPFDLEPTILFALGGKGDVETAVDTPISRSPSLPGVIFSSSWARPPHPCPPVPLPMKTRRPWGWRNISWGRMGEAGEEKVRGVSPPPTLLLTLIRGSAMMKKMTPTRWQRRRCGGISSPLRRRWQPGEGPGRGC